MTFYHEFDGELFEKHQLINKHILIKNQITHFIKYLNQIKYNHIDYYQEEEDKARGVNQRKIEQIQISQIKNEPTDVLLEKKIQSDGCSKIKSYKSTSHIPMNRRKNIQSMINSEHHIPILNSAKTWSSVQKDVF
jgi:hypothetical protein